MKIPRLLLLTLIFLSKLTFAQKLQDNSIGVVYIISENEKNYALKIVFPLPFITEFQYKKPLFDIKLVMKEFDFPNKIYLFDESGIFDSLEIQEKGKIQLWCENDGGVQYRPETHLIVDKGSVSKKLIQNIEIQNICCFALANPKAEVKKNEHALQKFSNNDIRLKGRYNITDWAFICAEHDESNNCDWTFVLHTNGQNYDLRCCGP